MCEDKGYYTELPAITIGGGTGDYLVQCPILSCMWAEYAIDTVVNGDGGTGAIVVSGNSVPVALDYTGDATKKLNTDVLLRAVPIRVPATTTQIINSSYERITNSERKVFVRIDAAASTSMYITIRFRIRKLTIIPGPFHEIHPDFMEEINKARSEAIKDRLAALGIPAYAEEGD